MGMLWKFLWMTFLFELKESVIISLSIAEGGRGEGEEEGDKSNFCVALIGERFLFAPLGRRIFEFYDFLHVEVLYILIPWQIRHQW